MPMIFRNATIFDGDSPQLKKGLDLLVQGETIAKISPAPIEANPDVPSIDCTGRVLMPGLIDAHVHVYIAGLDLTRVARAPLSYLAHYAARFLRASLDRGFTTVRDVGGGDVGLASALKEGLIEGAPRLFYGGRAISQTGGHADFRPGTKRFRMPVITDAHAKQER
ncbi:MAG: amidohydrolase family protein [Bryobacteraceae bacterium]